MKRLLVLRPLGLGDALTGVPAYRALARAFPDYDRILAAPAPLHGLVPLFGGAFTRAIDVRPLEALPARLAGVDVAVDLHGRGPASQRILLALAPRRLVSFANAAVPETAGGAPFVDDEHEVARWCRMLAHHGIPADGADVRLDDARVGPPAFARATVVHPGAASESRRWPIERWVEVVRFCETRGERVVLTGNASEVGRCAEIARRAEIPVSRSLAGATTLRELASLVASARRVIAGDTGIGHLATAFGTPSILLFGPTSPAQWGPPADPRHRVLWAGETGDPHGDTVDPGLLAIGVADVVRAIERSRERSESPPVRAMTGT